MKESSSRAYSSRRERILAVSGVGIASGLAEIVSGCFSRCPVSCAATVRNGGRNGPAQPEKNQATNKSNR